MNEARILVVDDDRAFRVSTAALLAEEGYDVEGAEDATHAAGMLEQERFDLTLMDVRMPGLDGISLVEALRKRGETVPIMMISGFGTVESAVRALHLGADDFVTKPIEPDVLLTKVASLLDRRPVISGGTDHSHIVGKSDAWKSVTNDIEQVGPTSTTVLITGETGTGKELVAKAVHDASSRKAKPFLAINCAALSDNLLESELFGHVKGAFTGAIQDKIGLFEAAKDGTIFLDEIGDITPAVQTRLLRVLQNKEFFPVGSTKTLTADVRVIAATNRNLSERVKAGLFREDLYYRLNVFAIDLPPLRERKGDIAALVEFFLSEQEASRRATQGSSKRESAVSSSSRISPLAFRMLMTYHWPGNVRQLFAVLESSLVRAGDGTIQAQHLPQEIRDRDAHGSERVPKIRYRDVDDADEAKKIRGALSEASGGKAQAAAMLGMSRTTLWRKMREYGIEK